MIATPDPIGTVSDRRSIPDYYSETPVVVTLPPPVITGAPRTRNERTGDASTISWTFPPAREIIPRPEHP